MSRVNVFLFLFEAYLCFSKYCFAPVQLNLDIIKLK
ncbi:hypothetical protein NC652_021167 [Populus alba x Populus x berolinensis]|nr:hypothetical protein NC652_021167 [Populus alba x Populus x berolinensis]